jgi:hypothetical protein
MSDYSEMRLMVNLWHLIEKYVEADMRAELPRLPQQVLQASQIFQSPGHK